MLLFIVFKILKRKRSMIDSKKRKIFEPPKDRIVSCVW